MATIAPDIIKALTDKHIAYYRRLIESGRRDVRVNECRGYLKVWKSVAEKDYDWDKLSRIERMEVEDAFFDTL